MSTPSHTSRRTYMMMSFALEASLSLWGMWSMMAREQMGWKVGAMLFTLSLLLIQGVRSLRAVHFLDGIQPELRGALVGMAVSVAGWLAIIILFTLITLYPELEVSMIYLIPAFLCHIGGALLAMHALNTPSGPPQP